MSRECDKCGHDPANHCRAHRRDLAECEQCGATLCIDCLAKSAVEAELMSETDADTIASQGDAGAFMQRCEECGGCVCPSCFEEEEAPVRVTSAS